MNERIRVPQVRLIAEDGSQVGILTRDDALQYARQRDLDLVEVAAEARPPVVRVLDYSKYKYEQEQKAKAARRHQRNINVREIKLRPKIAENDYSTKKGHVERFLKGQDKVKVTIMFRGREMTHPERGERLLMRLAEDVRDLGVVEQRPTQDGRNMVMMLGPVKRQVTEEERPTPGPAPTAAAGNGDTPPVAPTPPPAPAAQAADSAPPPPAAGADSPRTGADPPPAPVADAARGGGTAPPPARL